MFYDGTGAKLDAQQAILAKVQVCQMMFSFAQSKSVHLIKNLFLDEHPIYSPFGVRFSIHPYSVFEKLHSYPLYAVAGFLSTNHPDLRERLDSLIA